MSNLLDITEADFTVPADAQGGVLAAVESFLARHPEVPRIEDEKTKDLPPAARALSHLDLMTTPDASGALTGLRFAADKLPAGLLLDDVHSLFIALAPYVKPKSKVVFREYGDDVVLHTFTFTETGVAWKHRRQRKPRRQTLLDEIFALEQQKHYDKALALLDGALKKDPRDWHLHYQRGNILSRLNRMSEAIDVFRRILANDDQEAAHWKWLSEALFEVGEYDEAIDALGRAAEGSQDAYGEMYAWALYNSRRFEGALTALAACRPSDRASPRVYLEADEGRAACLYELGRFDELLELTSSMLSLFEEHKDASHLSLPATVYFHRAAAFLAYGKEGDALAMLEKLLDPTACFWTFFASFERATGNFDAGRARHQRTLEKFRGVTSPKEIQRLLLQESFDERLAIGRACRPNWWWGWTPSDSSKPIAELTRRYRVTIDEHNTRVIEDKVLS